MAMSWLRCGVLSFGGLGALHERVEGFAEEHGEEDMKC
jgi:hypothetical protein